MSNFFNISPRKCIYTLTPIPSMGSPIFLCYRIRFSIFSDQMFPIASHSWLGYKFWLFYLLRAQLGGQPTLKHFPKIWFKLDSTFKQGFKNKLNKEYIIFWYSSSDSFIFFNFQAACVYITTTECVYSLSVCSIC